MSGRNVPTRRAVRANAGAAVPTDAQGWFRRSLPLALRAGLAELRRDPARGMVTIGLLAAAGLAVAASELREEND